MAAVAVVRCSTLLLVVEHRVQHQGPSANFGMNSWLELVAKNQLNCLQREERGACRHKYHTYHRCHVVWDCIALLVNAGCTLIEFLLCITHINEQILSKIRDICDGKPVHWLIDFLVLWKPVGEAEWFFVSLDSTIPDYVLLLL